MIHMRTHTREKPYKCKVCTLELSVNSILFYAAYSITYVTRVVELKYSRKFDQDQHTVLIVYCFIYCFETSLRGFIQERSLINVQNVI